jgi:2-oxoglutarate dehydrogenase E2 component (dihydrolipoamide succinyltransferase)
MAVDIVVPELGESVVEATVARWLKAEGDPVAVGEPVVELETDKVNLEVGAEKGGVLASIAVGAGEDVAVGDVLGQIDEEAATGAAESARETPEPEKGVGEARVEAEGQTHVTAPPESTPALAAEAESGPKGGDGHAATPVAQRMAAEHNVDLSEVTPSGERDRVTKRDVQRHLEARVAQKEASAPPAKEQPAPVSASQARNGDRREERVRMSRRRRTIARRLVEAQQTAAMLTTFNEVDMSAVMALRARRKEAFQRRHGVKLGIASFFVRAAVGALKAFPRLNAEIDGDEMVLKHYYDIGVAIGDPEGLVVPVLRDVDAMTFAQIETAIRRFAEQVETGTLALEDLQGGTFTITNGGVFGSMLSTPILNPPQVGILGLHKIEDRPVAVDGEVVIRPIMYVALSYDHRIVDGREAVQFLVRVKELVEDPETMLLEG